MPKFAVPDRRKPEEKDEIVYYKEVDVSSGVNVFSDERPVVIEGWYDSETDMFFKTAFYSRDGIEGWTENDHLNYLMENGQIQQELKYRLAILEFTDPSGNSLWSVTWAA